MIRYFLSFFIIGLFHFCSEQHGNKTYRFLTEYSNLFKVFDVASVLNNTGNNVALKILEDLKTSSLTLKDKSGTYSSTPTLDSLVDLRTAWTNTRKIQKIAEILYFGPADVPKSIYTKFDPFQKQIYLDTASINSILTDSDAITLNRIQSLGSAKKGLIGLEYLIFDDESGNNDVGLIHSKNLSNQKRIDYINYVSQVISNDITSLYNEWSPKNGNYVSSFANGTGTFKSKKDVIDTCVNELKNLTAVLRILKIETPAGLSSKNFGTISLDKQESRFSQNAIIDLYYNLIGIESFYIGAYDNSNTHLGLSDYTSSLNSDLDKRLLNAISELKNLSKNLMDNQKTLSSLIQADMDTVKNLQSKLKVMEVIIENELIPTLGALSLPSDVDGD